MFQIATAFELHVGGTSYTLSLGWGTASVPGRQMYVPLFGLFNQKAVGARRYGVVVLGFYVTLQKMEIAKAAADVQRQMSASKPRGPMNSALRNSAAAAGAMPPGPAVRAVPKPAPAPLKATSPNAEHIDVV